MKRYRTPIIIALMALMVMAVSGQRMMVTRSALNPSTVRYVGEMEVSHLDVALLENEKEVSGNELLKGLPDDIDPGKRYCEKHGIQL